MIYSKARDRIRSGDLIAFRGTSRLSRLIRIVTGGAHSHVAVAWRFRERLFLLEALEGRGVTLRAASNALPFDWLPTDAGWSADIETLALERLGKPYSYMDALRAGLGRKLTGDGDICSEYAHRILHKAGVIPEPILSPTPALLVEHFRWGIKVQ